MLHILALSSSGNTASAALLTDGAVADEIVCESGRTHSETLMPAAERLLNRNGLAARDMDVFAVDTGPGSFTGVRIGVCCVNALAAALMKPVIAVDSLTAHFLDIGYAGGEIAVLLDARGQRGYAAKFLDAEMTDPPRAVDVAEFLKCVSPGTTFTGDGAFAYRELIEKTIPHAKFTESALLASRVALKAFDKYQKGETARSAEPLYLRSSQAERMYDLRHGK